MINSELPFLPFDLTKIVKEVPFKLRSKPIMTYHTAELSGRFEPNDCANWVNLGVGNHFCKGKK